MRTLAWRLCVLLLCSGAIAQAQDLRRSSPASQGLDEVRLERLDAALQRYVDDERIAGSVTLVLRDGRVVYSAAKGLRDIEANQRMTEDTIFRIASQTKAIISTGIMILHERGALQIGDPLSRYFPEWANTKVAVAKNGGGFDLVPLTRPITLRDLLTHTSGIGYGGFASTGPANQAWVDAGISGWYFASHDEPIGETVKRMAALPQQAQPGTQWIYGYNLDILGAVIEVASGQDLATFLRTEIFGPLDMDDTQFYVDPDEANRLAVVYQPRANGRGLERAPAVGSMLGQGEYVDGPRVSYSGGAGLTSTAGDYAKFLQMTLNGGILNGVRILAPKTVELMVTDHLNGIPFQPGNGMGLGFSVLKDLGARGTMGSVGEYGWGGAYHSTYWVDPVEKLVVVYLTQLLNAGGVDDFSKLRSGIYQSIIESDAEYLFTR